MGQARLVLGEQVTPPVDGLAGAVGVTGQVARWAIRTWVDQKSMRVVRTSAADRSRRVDLPVRVATRLGYGRRAFAALAPEASIGGGPGIGPDGDPGDGPEHRPLDLVAVGQDGHGPDGIHLGDRRGPVDDPAPERGHLLGAVHRPAHRPH